MPRPPCVSLSPYGPQFLAGCVIGKTSSLHTAAWGLVIFFLDNTHSHLYWQGQAWYVTDSLGWVYVSQGYLTIMVIFMCSGGKVCRVICAARPWGQDQCCAVSKIPFSIIYSGGMAHYAALLVSEMDSSRLFTYFYRSSCAPSSKQHHNGMLLCYPRRKRILEYVCIYFVNTSSVLASIKPGAPPSRRMSC